MLSTLVLLSALSLDNGVWGKSWDTPPDNAVVDVLSGVEGGMSDKLLSFEVFGEDRGQLSLYQTFDVMVKLFTSTVYVLELSGFFNF